MSREHRESDNPAIGAPTPVPAGAVLTVAAEHTVRRVGRAGALPLRGAIRSNTKAGWLAACTQMPSILQPFFGHLADRLVLRWVVMLAPAVTATGMSLVGWAPGYLGLVLLLIVVGLSSAAFHAVGSAGGPSRSISAG
jgi:MFS family permease